MYLDNREYPMCKTLPLLIAAVLMLAFAPAPVYRPKKAGAPSPRIIELMEGFRNKLPPAEGEGEMNGISPIALGDYVPNHLSGIARRMRVTTKAECLALLPYLKDRDMKLRFIAHEAIIDATKSSNGSSFDCIGDLESERHRKMAEKLADLVDRLDR